MAVFRTALPLRCCNMRSRRRERRAESNRVSTAVQGEHARFVRHAVVLPPCASMPVGGSGCRGRRHPFLDELAEPSAIRKRLCAARLRYRGDVASSRLILPIPHAFIAPAPLTNNTTSSGWVRKEKSVFVGKKSATNGTYRPAPAAPPLPAKYAMETHRFIHRISRSRRLASSPDNLYLVSPSARANYILGPDQKRRHNR